MPGGMLASFLPLPFVMMTRRHGVAGGILLAGLFGIAFALATNPLTAAHTVIVQGGAGILIGWSAARRRPILEQTTLAARDTPAGRGHLLAAALPGIAGLLLVHPARPGRPGDAAVAGDGGRGERHPGRRGGAARLRRSPLSRLQRVGMLVNCLLCSILAGLMPPAGIDPGRPLLRDWRLPSWLTWVFILTGFAAPQRHVGLARDSGGSNGGAAVPLPGPGFRGGHPQGGSLAGGNAAEAVLRAMLLVQPIGLAMLLATLVLLGLVDFRFDFRKERPGATPV